MGRDGVNGWTGVEFCSHGPFDLYPSRPRWVYYMYDPDVRLTKIGATAQLRRRYAALVSEGRPNLEIHAVEVGYFVLERRRHDQFAGLRVKSSKGHDSEWFRVGLPLREHISALRLDCGDPTRLLDVDCRCQLPSEMAAFKHEKALRQRVEPWEGFVDGAFVIDF